VLERSLEIAEVLRGEEGDDEDRKPVTQETQLLLKKADRTLYDA